MMLTLIFHPTRRVITEPALGLFEEQAHEFSKKVRLRLITRNEAIEMLEVKSTYNQIVSNSGRQEAERIMARNLNTEVPA